MTVLCQWPLDPRFQPTVYGCLNKLKILKKKVMKSGLLSSKYINSKQKLNYTKQIKTKHYLKVKAK